MLNIGDVVQTTNSNPRYFKVVKIVDPAEFYLNSDDLVYTFQECSKKGKLKDFTIAYSVSNTERKFREKSLKLVE